MSNVWYDKLLTRVGKGLLNLNTLTDPKIIAVETSEYTFSQSHEYLSDLPLAARLAVANMVNTHFGTAVGGVVEATDPQDYVARWELESNTTAPDSTYRGHDGTVNGSPVAVSAGVIGNAITLDGVDDYISIPNHADLRPTVLSVSAWVKGPTLGYVMSSSNSVGGVKSGFLLNSHTFYIRSNTGATWDVDQAYTSIVSNEKDGSWHHVTGTYDGANLKIYLDGVLEGTKAYTGGLAYNATNPVRVGNVYTEGAEGNYFTDQMDDVRLYNRAISAEEVDAIYQSRIIAPPEDFVAEWNLESDGTESLGNHPATLVASPTFGAGWEGNAMTLNGSTQYGTVAQHADLRPVNVTIAGWVNTTDTSNQMSVFSNSEIQTPYSGFQLRVDSGKPRLGIFSHTGHTVGVDYQVIASTSSVNDGDWHHIAATYDGADLKIYVNGVLEGTQAYANGIGYDVLDTIGIGVHKAGGTFSQYFNGSIDKLQVFNRAVTAAEITSMYNVTLVGGVAGLVEAWLTADDPTFTQPAAVAPVDYTALYTMNNADISAPTINDTSGSTNTHNATMIATPTTGETGQVGEAVLFNGTTQYATIVNHADFNVAAFTIAGWINLATVSADNDLFDNYNENTGATLIAGFRFYVTSTGKIALLVGKNTGLVSGTDFETAISSTSVDTEAWIHVAATYDGANIKVYISGILNGTTAWVGVDYTSALTRIAARSTAAITADKFFGGKVDDLKFYPRALTSDEISTINDKSFTEKTVKQLVIYEDTGVEATSPLLLHIDEATILPKITESGKDLEVLWQGKGIARL